jgi:hypothetical protein
VQNSGDSADNAANSLREGSREQEMAITARESSKSTVIDDGEETSIRDYSVERHVTDV